MPRYEIVLYWSDADQAFIAEVPELPGCAADGQARQEALANAEAIIDECSKPRASLIASFRTRRADLSLREARTAASEVLHHVDAGQKKPGGKAEALPTKTQKTKTVSARVIAGIIALLAPLVAGQELPAPHLPFYDWKACPFEGCGYKGWTAGIPVTVYNTWEENRQRVAQVGKGEAVLAVTGGVETLRPGLIRMDRDLEGSNLKRGDVILTYAYRGEGFSAVWFKGRYYPDFDISFTKWRDGTGCGGAHCAATYVDLGDKVWWAQIRLASGLTGWVNMEETRVNGFYTLGASEY